MRPAETAIWSQAGDQPGAHTGAATPNAPRFAPRPPRTAVVPDLGLNDRIELLAPVEEDGHLWPVGTRGCVVAVRADAVLLDVYAVAVARARPELGAFDFLVTAPIRAVHVLKRGPR